MSWIDDWNTNTHAINFSPESATFFPYFTLAFLFVYKERAAAKQADREKKLEALRKEKQLQKQLERQQKTEEYEAAMAASKRREEKKERKMAKGWLQKFTHQMRFNYFVTP